MIVFLAALLWLSESAFLLWTLSQRLRGLETIVPDELEMVGEPPLITVIIPARNESANISRCLMGLLTQRYPPQSIDILVVDDNSTDRTAIVRQIAKREVRVRLMEAGALPAGWIGKQHACWMAANAALGEWLCFIDADTVATPGLIGKAVSIAQSKGIDLLSLQPSLAMEAFWEKAINPATLVALTLAMDIRRINNPALPDAAANGNFILIRRRVYEAVQGHSSVRAEMHEDVALARRVKCGGYRLHLMPGLRLMQARTYTSLRELWEGSSKNATDVLRDIPSMITALIAALLLAWTPVILPVWIWIKLTGATTVLNGIAMGLALLGSTTSLIALIMAMRFFRIPIRYSFLFPFGLTLGVVIMLAGVWHRVAGHSTWKGRQYPFVRGSLGPQIYEETKNKTGG